MKVSEISQSGKTVYLLLFLSFFQLMLPADENMQARHSFFYFSGGTIRSFDLGSMHSREIAPVTLSDEAGHLVQAQGKRDRLQLKMQTPATGSVIYYRQLSGENPVFYADLKDVPLVFHILPDTLLKGFGSMCVEPSGARYAYSERNSSPREYSDFRIGEKESTRSILSFENESWMHHAADFTWSPDSRWIAYTVQRRQDGHGTYELQMYNTENNEMLTISKAETGALRYICWDPTSTKNNSRLIYTRINDEGVSLFLAEIEENRPPRVEQLFRKDSIWRGQQRLDAAYTADGTILAKHLEYTRPSSSDSESELLSFGSEQKGYTASSLFSSVEAGIRGFGYYTPAVAGPIVLSDDTSFWILDPATGDRRQVDLPIKACYMLPSLYGIPNSPWMVFEHEIDGDREIMGLNVDTAKVYNLTQDPSADDYFYYVVTEK